MTKFDRAVEAMLKADKFTVIIGGLGGNVYDYKMRFVCQFPDGTRDQAARYAAELTARAALLAALSVLRSESDTPVARACSEDANIERLREKIEKLERFVRASDQYEAEFKLETEQEYNFARKDIDWL